MATTAINTLRYARRLKAACVNDHQAEEMADALGEELVQNLVTKTDLDQAATALKTDLDHATAALKTDIAELRTELKTDIANLEARLTWRLLGGVALLLTIAVGLIKLA